MRHGQEVRAALLLVCSGLRMLSLVVAVLSQLRGQELVLLLPDHGQPLPGFFQLLLFPQHLLLSSDNLQDQRIHQCSEQKEAKKPHVGLKQLLFVVQLLTDSSQSSLYFFLVLMRFFFVFFSGFCLTLLLFLLSLLSSKKCLRAKHQAKYTFAVCCCTLWFWSLCCLNLLITCWCLAACCL